MKACHVVVFVNVLFMNVNGCVSCMSFVVSFYACVAFVLYMMLCIYSDILYSCCTDMAVT